MNMPGFTADVTLQSASGHYHTRESCGSFGQAIVSPQVLRSLGRGFGSMSQRLRFRGGGLGFTCQGIECSCSGDADCNDMFSTDLCGDIAVCYEDGTCRCLRV
jgi:hypothetical protein